MSNYNCNSKLKSDSQIREREIRHLDEAKKNLEYHNQRKAFFERDLVDTQRKIDCKLHVWEFYGHGLYKIRVYKCRKCHAMNSDEK